MSRIQERAESAAGPEENSSASSPRRSDVAEKGPKTRAAAAAPQPAQFPQSHKDKEEDEDLKAPLELLIKFLAAVTDRDFESAHHLCQMILIYEPDNPEACEFLPLIHGKLLEEREAEQRCEEDDDGEKDESDDDDSDDSGSSSHSSLSTDDDDDEEEMCVNGHEPCPPS